MSKLLKTTQCPICHTRGDDTSKDNLALYDDGHQYCYACGYFKASPNTVESTKEKIMVIPPTKEENTNGVAFLPTDISGNLSSSAKRWLLSYGLSFEEMRKFWWSEINQQLIYPVSDLEGNLIFWQARNFDVRNQKKYQTSGNLKDHLEILGTEGALILVEDVVSAIRVSREYQSMPLFGCRLTREQLIRIRDFGIGLDGELGIWLDPDKVQESLKYRNMARELGIKAFSVMGTQDPKAYGHNELIELVEASHLSTQS